MKCRIRKWELSDAKDLAATLSNKKVQKGLIYLGTSPTFSVLPSER